MRLNNNINSLGLPGQKFPMAYKNISYEITRSTHPSHENKFKEIMKKKEKRKASGPCSRFEF